MAEAIIGKINKPTKPELIYDEEYKHPIVASSYAGHTSLLSNVSGEPWLVEYYRQVQGASTEAEGFQPDSIETYQSYEKIKGLIVKLSGETSDNWDSEWSTVGQEGQITTIFDLAPLPYDVFIADIGDGRAGLFQLTDEPRIKTVAMDKCYEVGVRLIAIVDKDIAENLAKKTIKEYVYSKDAAIRGGTSVLSVGDFDANKSLAKIETVLIQDYLGEFYYEPEKTVIVPINDKMNGESKQARIQYDPYLAKFLSYTFTTKKTGLRDSITTLGIGVGKNRVGGTKLNIWDMFYQFNFDYPKRYKQDYYLFNSDDLLNTRYYGGVYYSKVEQVILTESEGAGLEGYQGSSSLLVDTFIIPPTEKYPKRKGSKIEYFFSDEFYTGNPTLPHEKFIFDFFKNRTIDKRALLSILEGYWDLSPIERCYMGGIYVLAIRISLSSTYQYL